jgi:hypothetical protein
MIIFKLLMQLLARVDFKNYRDPRFNNQAYINEYSKLYSNAENQAHCTNEGDYL